MTDTIKTTVIAGTFALLGGIGGALVTGISQARLANQKYNSDLVLKALKSDSPEQWLETLKLLTETRLIKDNEVADALRAYALSKKDSIGSIPQVVSSGFEAPVISNSRIFLLIGNKQKENLLAPYRQELEEAGFKVLGAKYINDPGRSVEAEIRYFHPSDKIQAQKIAEVVKAKLTLEKLNVKQYTDANAAPGYIEIWFGK